MAGKEWEYSRQHWAQSRLCPAGQRLAVCPCSAHASRGPGWLFLGVLPDAVPSVWSEPYPWFTLCVPTPPFPAPAAPRAHWAERSGTPELSIWLLQTAPGSLQASPSALPLRPRSHGASTAYPPRSRAGPGLPIPQLRSALPGRRGCRALLSLDGQPRCTRFQPLSLHSPPAAKACHLEVQAGCRQGTEPSSTQGFHASASPCPGPRAPLRDGENPPRSLASDRDMHTGPSSSNKRG